MLRRPGIATLLSICKGELPMMIEKSDAALRRSRLLLHASEALSATSTTADVLVTVPALLRDTLGATYAAVVPAGPARGASSAVSEALTRTAIRDRRSQFYESAIDLTVEHPSLAEDLTHLGWQAAVCAPLPGEAGTPTGALLLAWDEPRAFYVFDRAVVATLALYVGQALDRAVKHDARAAITEALQQAMISQLPRVDDYDLAAYYRAADAQRVGGDWYDVIPGPHDRLALVIGDVVGHDPAAAARMGQLRNMLRAYLVDRREPPSTLLRRLDAANHALGEPTMATAVVAFLDRAPQGGHRLRWSNAGHPPPVLITSSGEVRSLTGNDTLLGARRNTPRHTYTAPLPPGATLLLHTDGLVETREHNIDEGFARLHRRLRGHGGIAPREMLSQVAADLAGDRSDDIAMLAVRVPRT
jgi:sigma-B regulation protein RsbU (phosphoserine phosphatase)